MNIDTYNLKGEKTGQTRLPKEIFGVKLNPDLVYQVVLSQQKNMKQTTAHAKDRAEVRGGGKKPWRQKGTGRARHGSIRSPLWKGGGVTFGPRKEKNLERKIPNKMRRKALFMVLSEKANNNLILAVEDLNMEKPKTKAMVEMLSKIYKKKESLLVALAGKNDIIFKSIRNLPKTKAMEARELNVVDLLNHKNLILEKEAVKKMEETFLKK